MEKNTKTKITTAAVVIATAMLVITVVISCTSLLRSSKESITSATISAVSFYAQQINAKLEIEKQKMEDLGESVRYEKYDSVNRDGMYDFLVDSTAYMPEMFAIYVGCPDNYCCFSDAWIPGEDYIVTEREWYKLAAASDSPVITEPYIDADTGKMVVTIASAVRGDSGSITSVVAADMFITDIQDIASGFSYTKNGYPVLVTASGRVIIHCNEAFLPGIGSAGNERYTDFSTTHTDMTDIRTENGCRTGKMTDYDGISKFVVSSDITASNWTLYYVMWEKELYSAITGVIRIFTMMIPFVAAIIVALLMLVVGHRQTMEQLEEAMVRTDAASRAKSDFLANMSHEIRTPMNAIIGMCELILREYDISDTVREYCANIQNSGRSLLSIINDILDFSKIESGKMELIQEEFNIASMINDVINMAVSRKGNKPIELIVHVDPTIPAGLYGDEIRIRQIIINLVTNAIKYSNEGCISIRFSQAKHSYGINLNVSVSDTGIGITEENMEKLFSSFQQVDTRKNRAVEGTGLGLAITKRLISQMGGFINVESTYGEGSEFRFVIPLKVTNSEPFISVRDAEQIHAAGYLDFAKYRHPRVAREYRSLIRELTETLHTEIVMCGSFEELCVAAETGNCTHIFTAFEEYVAHSEELGRLAGKGEVLVIQDRMNAVDLPPTMKSLFKPFYVLSVASVFNHENVINVPQSKSLMVRFVAPRARLLVVDDNPINLEVASGLLRPYRVQVFTVDSARAAIRILQSEKFDLILMDHMMPGMDGVEATQAIRAMEGDYYKRVPIIALTANAVSGAKEMFLRSGMNDFIAKPIEVSVLDRALKTWLPKELMESSAEAEESAELSDAAEVPEGSDLFSPKMGLFYMGGSLDTYHKVLRAYLDKGSEKKLEIQKLFEEKAWDNYVIEVHALKSTSLSVGARTLSDTAKELEMAGKSGNYQKIEEMNSRLLELYEQVLGEGDRYLTAAGAEEKPEKIVVDAADLPEMDAARVAELVQCVLDACEDLSSDEIETVYQEAAGFACGGVALEPLFARVLETAGDFEYEEAAKQAEAILEQIGGQAL